MPGQPHQPPATSMRRLEGPSSSSHHPHSTHMLMEPAARSRRSRREAAVQAGSRRPAHNPSRTVGTTAMPAAGEAVSPKGRARFVDESASVARGHGEVWKRGLQVEAPDAPHIAGTYTFAYGPTHGMTTSLAEGCPHGYPIWKKDDGTYITYGVTDFPSQVTWYFGQQDAPVTVSASWPHAHLMRQGPQAMTTVAKDGPFAIINQTEWEKPADPPAEGLQKIQITIRQIPHPKHEEDSFMYCQTWKVPPGVPTEQDRFTQFLAEFRTSLLPGQGGMRVRNSIDDTIKQVLCPPQAELRHESR
eukprot:COSAG01_NODE_15_length_40797_cov_245.690550_14_plen_302_part_00